MAFIELSHFLSGGYDIYIYIIYVYIICYGAVREWSTPTTVRLKKKGVQLNGSYKYCTLSERFKKTG